MYFFLSWEQFIPLDSHKRVQQFFMLKMKTFKIYVVICELI